MESTPYNKSRSHGSLFERPLNELHWYQDPVFTLSTVDLYGPRFVYDHACGSSLDPIRSRSKNLRTAVRARSWIHGY